VPESRNLVLSAVASCAAFDRVVGLLPAASGTVTVGGLSGSAGAALLAALHEKLPQRVFVAVADSVGAAESLEADLDALLGAEAAWLYPQREALPYEADEPHLEIGGLRVEAVEALFSGRGRLLVATLKALQERSPVPEHLAGLRLTLTVGDALGLNELVSTLEGRGFERVALVEEVGQLAVRGGIVDLFSFGSPEPVRVEFWGDEITSLRTFDILDQRSTAQLTQVHVLPVDFRRGSQGGSVPRSLLQLLPDGAVLVRVEHAHAHAHVDPREPWGVSAERTWRHVLDVRKELLASGGQAPPPEDLFMPPQELTAALARFPTLVLQAGRDAEVLLECEPPPAIDRNVPRLQALLREGAAEGEETVILCDNEGQLQRLEELLDAAGGIPIGARVGLGALEGGFQLKSSYPPLRVFTDHEIFRRSRRLRRGRRFRGAVALESLAQLTPGDYVVHMDHGVGRFRGLERVTVGGEEIEALAIEYAGEEILRVPVYRLDLVERWVGDTEEAEPPEVHRIGGKKWKTLRRRTEAAIEEMTAELIQLYARRAAAPGFAFSPDTRWQKEMESSFLYEDTPDQRKAAEDVKRDMESARPMDRLICGDVGYGKTEVALRAAFKAVQDGKQVAVLAPTTILVEQHRHTFEERLADYPVRIAALSRFRSATETKEILNKLATGHVDVAIGTHRLLSDDVDFKDLGLMIVDEEQRFGVKAKEKLKSLKTSVDVLTLTATPIPRTLYLSLTRIRDLSLIRTPPRDRMPIVTHVLPWSDHLLTDAIHRELDRGGQAFFLHNRVETIHAASERLKRLVPEARMEVAHGQMSPRDLDRIMTAFVDAEVDVLVCSSIIENGLDVPNANTLIVDRADRFGLSQLYQIRGRVGRSDRRAYCYLIVPPNLAEEAERRLRVLEHYTELGSGYSVALRDLELRGAGNLLGAEQSGFANAIGIDAYLRLVEHTVTRMKQGGESLEHSDPEVSMGGAAYLPEGYVSDGSQKLHLYRRLSKIRHQPEVDDLRRELADRFGEPPPEVERLLDQVTLRILGRQLGVERILIREKSARVNFRAEVVPRLAVLERPLRDRQVVVQVRRMAPLSLELQRVGPEPLAPTLIRALSVLGDKVQAA
jgi:transcription-repair coupling factor (superfamily II helicase)